MLNASVDNELNVTVEIKGNGKIITNDLLNVYKSVMEIIFEETSANTKEKRLIITAVEQTINRFHDEWLKDGE